MKQGSVLFATAFRMLFLLGAAFAALIVPLWLLALTGRVRLHTSLPLTWWHAHEMIFGFIAAVLAGFLLTAVANWTKRPTLRGVPLAALTGVWLVARVVASVGGSLPPWVAPVVDGSFVLALALAIGRPIVQARSLRNYSFPVLLAALGAMDVLLHASAAGWLSWQWGARALPTSLDLIALIIFVFGGRVIPMFTANGVSKPARPKGNLDWAGLGLMSLFSVSRFVMPASALTSGLAIAAGTINAARLYGWNGLATLTTPILWVLHLGWLLMSLGIAGGGAAHWIDQLLPSATLHLFTVGGVSLVILGMMARVSLGHTGRTLTAPRPVAVGFVVLLLAAAVRVVAPFLAAENYLDTLWVAAFGWSFAFAAFAIRYLPILIRPRADGKPG